MKTKEEHIEELTDMLYHALCQCVYEEAKYLIGQYMTEDATLEEHYEYILESAMRNIIIERD